MNRSYHTRLLIGLAAAWFSPAWAGPLEEARVNYLRNEVLLTQPSIKPRPAKIGNLVKDDIGVRTGVNARAELVFQDNTLTRIGAESTFSFKTGTRNMRLDSGTMLLEVPKGQGGAKIEAGSVTASITGTTVMIQHLPQRTVKFVVLEGSMKVALNGRLGQSVIMQPGHSIIMPVNAKVIPPPVTVKISSVMNTSTLANDEKFYSGKTIKSLPSKAIIAKEINRQNEQIASGETTPTNLVISSKGTRLSTVEDDEMKKMHAMDDRTMQLAQSEESDIGLTNELPPNNPTDPSGRPGKDDSESMITGGGTIDSGSVGGETPEGKGTDTTNGNGSGSGSGGAPDFVVEEVNSDSPPVDTAVVDTTTPPPETTLNTLNPAVATAVGTGTVFVTKIPSVATNAPAQNGRIYTPALGTASKYLFGTTSAFDSISGFNEMFGHHGDTIAEKGVAAYRFDSITITGEPTFDTADGPTDIILIGNSGISVLDPASFPANYDQDKKWEIGGLGSLTLATVDGPINIGRSHEVNSTGDNAFDYLHLYARGANGNITVTGDINLDSGALIAQAEGSIFSDIHHFLRAKRIVYLQAGGDITIRKGLRTMSSKIVAGGTVTIPGMSNTVSSSSAYVVNGLTVLAKNLDVTGNLNVGNGGSLIIGSNLNAGNFKLATFQSIQVGSDLAAGETIAVGDITVGGSATTGKITAGEKLDIAANLTTTGKVTAKNILVGGEMATTEILAGTAQIGGSLQAVSINLTDRLTVGGDATTTGSISAREGIEIGGSLSTKNISSSSGSLQTGGGLNAQSILVGGNVTSGGTTTATTITAGGNIQSKGQITANALTAGGNIQLDSGATLAESAAAGGNISANGAIQAKSILAGGRVTSGDSITARSRILAGGNVSTVGSITAGSITAGGSILPGTDLFAGNIKATGALVVPGTYTSYAADGSVAPRYIETAAVVFNGVNFAGKNGTHENHPTAGNSLYIKTGEFTSSGTLDFTGGDYSGDDDGDEGHHGAAGGTLIVDTTASGTDGDIAINGAIEAASGLSTSNDAKSVGGKVELKAKGTITANSRIRVSDESTNRKHKTGGSIKLDSRKTSGTAIRITSSGDLRALMDGADSSKGGTIKFVSSGGDILVENGAKLDAKKGTVDIRNNGENGRISIANANVRADYVKVGAMGTNGELLVGGGTFNAGKELKLYANGANGKVRFTGNTTLDGEGKKYVAGKTVEVDFGRVVTFTGNPDNNKIYTDNRKYLGSGGVSATNGAVIGAQSASFSNRPGL